MLKYGFYGGVVSSSLFHICSHYFSKFIYMSPELVFNTSLSKIKKNEQLNQILGQFNAGQFKSYSFESGGISLIKGIYIRPKMKMIYDISSNRGNGTVTISCSQNGISIIFDHIGIKLNNGTSLLIEGLGDVNEQVYYDHYHYYYYYVIIIIIIIRPVIWKHSRNLNYQKYNYYSFLINNILKNI